MCTEFGSRAEQFRERSEERDAWAEMFEADLAAVQERIAELDRRSGMLVP
jgi:hypothetical protein